MQKTRQNKKLGIRVAAAVLALAIIAPMPGVFGTSVAAATSLSGIEQIKSRGKFSILEIVPQEGTGSIGYYASGQEPTANWLQKVASISGDQTKSGAQKRKEYADNLFDSLGPKGTGLMGEAKSDSSSYPLVQTGYYQEYLPWDEGIPQGAVDVSLDYPEETTVTGVFKEDPEGYYIKNSTYVPDDKAGTHVEKALYYEYNKPDATNYYRVDFERVILTSSNIQDYVDKNIPLYVLKTDGAFPYYVYAGTLTSKGDFTVDLDVNNEANEAVNVDDPNEKKGFGYFVGKVNLKKDPITNAPVTTNSPEPSELEAVDFTGETIPAVGTTVFVEKEGKYVPVLVTEDFEPVEGSSYYKLVTSNAYSYSAFVDYADAYRPAVGDETGLFKEQLRYHYVGNTELKNVNRFTLLEEGSATQTVTYDKISVTGGYTNSEWFKRYVLDMPEGTNSSAFRLTVNSVTPEYLNELTPEMLRSIVASYDLVVVSAGFYLAMDNNSTTPATGSTIQYQTDVSSAVAAVLSTKPRVVDTRIENATNLAALKGGTTSPAVSTVNDVDVYNFAAGTDTDPTDGVDDIRSALATNKFHTAFVNTTPYAAVLEEITYENELRGNNNLLSTEISMATCIRYIINVHRARNLKTSLNVLDIQPVAKYDGNSGPLTVAQVLSWFPTSMQNQLAKKNNQGQPIGGHNINITHMSTSALIGKVEDITEQYDLIYIGADEVPSTLPSGMYYANIGREETVSGYLVGLLENDVVHTNNATGKGYSNTRYSGNDLTTKKRDELVAFAKAGLPIIISDELVNSSDARPASVLSATVTANGNRLTAAATLSPNVRIDSDPSFKWYRTGQSSSISSEESITPTSGNTYYCKVTVWVDGVPYTATSNQVKVTLVEGNKELEKKNYGSYQNWYCMGRYGIEDSDKAGWFSDKKVTLTTADDANYLTITMGNHPGFDSIDIQSYQWYKVESNYGYEWGSPVSNNEGRTKTLSLSSTNDSFYYCEVEIDFEESGWNGDEYTRTYRSPAYRVVRGDDVITTTEIPNSGETAKIPAGVAGDNLLRKDRVDSKSLMYDALNSVWNKKDENGKDLYPNVMAETSAIKPERQDALVRALNLSRPAIVWYKDEDSDADVGPAATPVEYNGNNVANAANYNCSGNLYFNFHIENLTDPNPLMSRYKCNLYIDQNGDGRHTEEELVGIDYIGQYIGDPDSSRTQMVANGALESSIDVDNPITYAVQRTVDPKKFSGLVAWKLEVVKTDNDAVHASQKGFAYISPDDPNTTAVELTKLDILQITTSNHFFNNYTHPDLTTGAFKTLYDNLRGAGMYDITVSKKDAGRLCGKATWQDAYNEIKDYKMIILGFADCYGELDNNAALAVAEYIKTGKAVLFTHDTTSYWNLAGGQNVNNSLGGLVQTNSHPYWGYFFNTFIRDKVGLDRYGVTNAAFARADGTKFLKLGTDGKITPAESTMLKNAGYTPAYVPNTNQSAGATQGFTDAIIDQYKGTGNAAGNNPETTKVSRVNRGSITEYPFKLGETFSIATTHSQYYQLNMNADDIVVWYCLSDDGSSTANVFENEVNDVTNAYYIYNRGNITYSGAGHRPSLGASGDDSEIRLFVNTMIAAYRAGNSAPTVDFTTADGKNNAASLLIPTEFSQTKVGDVTTTTSTIVGGELDFYFVIQDTNLTANKSIAVELTYDDVADDGTDKGKLTGTELTATLDPIYRVDTGTEAVSTKLTSNTLYRTTLPDGVLKEFAKHTGEDGKRYNIHLRATTTLHHESTADSVYVGDQDHLNLMELGLLPLE